MKVSLEFRGSSSPVPLVHHISERLHLDELVYVEVEIGRGLVNSHMVPDTKGKGR